VASRVHLTAGKIVEINSPAMTVVSDKINLFSIGRPTGTKNFRHTGCLKPGDFARADYETTICRHAAILGLASN
jgi:hypothetical protein